MQKEQNIFLNRKNFMPHFTGTVRRNVSTAKLEEGYFKMVHVLCISTIQMAKKPANIAKIAATTFEPKEVAADELEVVAAVEVDVGEVAVPGAVVPPLEAFGVEAPESELEALVDTEPDDVVVAAPEADELSVNGILKVVVGGPVGVIVVPPTEEARIRNREFKKW